MQIKIRGLLSFWLSLPARALSLFASHGKWSANDTADLQVGGVQNQ
jgi:hypothetical protein